MLKLRLAYARQAAKNNLQTVGEQQIEVFGSVDHRKKIRFEIQKTSSHLQTTQVSSSNGDSNKLDHSQLEGMRVEDLISMLAETNVLDEQASLVSLIKFLHNCLFDLFANLVRFISYG